MKNTLTEELENTITSKNPAIWDMLSQRGKAIYFPYSGILGQSAEAKGKKYNATIGAAFEEDKSPMRLNSLMEMVNLEPKKVLPYAPSFGDPEIRKKWKEMIVEKNPSIAGKDFSNPVVTQALTHGLTVAAYLFLDPGDELLVPEPYWDNYDLLFEVSFGAKIQTVPCFKDNSRFDIDSFNAALDARKGHKIVVLLNFPNNPTGYTPTEGEMKDIAASLTRAASDGSKVVALIDDAYFGLVFEDGVAKESIFADLADAHENLLAVKIDGSTKEDYVWGLRVGFISFAIKGGDADLYKALADKAGGSIRGLISNCSQLSQSLLLNTFNSPNYAKEKQEKYDLLKARYDVIKSELDNHTEYADIFTPLPYNSGYFMCIKPAEGIDAESARKILVEKYETGVIALQGLLRIAFSSAPKDDIPQLLNNIYQACLEAKG